jgi:phage-related baseplate assembly protein
MLAISDLVTPVTSAEVRASIYSTLEAVGLNTTAWKTGSVVRTIIYAVSIVLAFLSTLISGLASSAFMDLAAGGWLTLTARYVYGVERTLATFATGEVTLTNTSGGSYTLDPDDLIVANPDSGATYRNTSTFTLLPMSSLTVAISAVEAGSLGTAVATQISVMVTTLAGVTCSNAAALVGLDDELDANLKVRCREKLGSLSPFGPWDAYSYAARNAVRADGTPIGVTRVLSTADGFGNVRTYAATASGGVTGTAGDLGTDLGRVDDAIQRNAAPLAVTATTLSATPRLVNVSYRLYMYSDSGLSEQALRDTISAAIATYLSTVPIGGDIIGAGPGAIYLDSITTTIRNAVEAIYHVTLDIPTADLALTGVEVAVAGAIDAVAITTRART